MLPWNECWIKFFRPLPLFSEKGGVMTFQFNNSIKDARVYCFLIEFLEEHKIHHYVTHRGWVVVDPFKEKTFKEKLSEVVRALKFW